MFFVQFGVNNFFVQFGVNKYKTNRTKNMISGAAAVFMEFQDIAFAYGVLI